MCQSLYVYFSCVIGTTTWVGMGLSEPGTGSLLAEINEKNTTHLLNVIHKKALKKFHAFVLCVSLWYNTFFLIVYNLSANSPHSELSYPVSFFSSKYCTDPLTLNI